VNCDRYLAQKEKEKGKGPGCRRGYTREGSTCEKKIGRRRNRGGRLLNLEKTTTRKTLARMGPLKKGEIERTNQLKGDR